MIDHQKLLDDMGKKLKNSNSNIDAQQRQVKNHQAIINKLIIENAAQEKQINRNIRTLKKHGAELTAVAQEQLHMAKKFTSKGLGKLNANSAKLKSIQMKLDK